MMARKPIAAVTGATGFLGCHTVAALAERGFHVRALIRRPEPHPLWQDRGIETVPGDLADETALQRLLTGADVVLHLAGLVRARSPKAFLAVNRDDAFRLASMLQRCAPAARLIGISSLAARAPHLSAYAASKSAGEQALRDGFGGKLCIVRPPVIYGPWDTATLSIFRSAAARIVPVAGHSRSRIAMIHVADAADAIAALAVHKTPPSLCTLADGNPQGYTPQEIMQTAAQALGHHPRYVRLPAASIWGAGLAGSLYGLLSRRPAIFNAGKAREMLHPDWSVSPAELLPDAIARPRITLDHGFSSAVAWYRAAGWLAPAHAPR
ncbi:NAD-dependent epimerase/dehydratase family protein [Granulibacter bethesdensis]|uniref:NAD-dependent epimerase/dehydratase family protein n=1 Tax=Granulibacter bethesdensis TaxID=364410 RepID=UPI0003F203F2|nr:SDR family NAD(P)-dependent oxidoreductase [Granulibacter bethesdensis]AHJ64615.1 NADH-ubiquinone oxidoreductase 39-40 kDa subunit -like protein [Granulibacter bethesdensis CGDNIH4]